MVFHPILKRARLVVGSANGVADDEENASSDLFERKNREVVGEMRKVFAERLRRGDQIGSVLAADFDGGDCLSGKRRSLARVVLWSLVALAHLCRRYPVMGCAGCPCHARHGVEIAEQRPHSPIPRGILST